MDITHINGDLSTLAMTQTPMPTATNEEIAVLFEKIFLQEIMKDIDFSMMLDDDEQQSTGPWQQIMLAGLTDELSKGQSLGLGRMLTENSNYIGGNEHDR